MWDRAAQCVDLRSTNIGSDVGVGGGWARPKASKTATPPRRKDEREWTSRDGEDRKRFEEMRGKNLRELSKTYFGAGAPASDQGRLLTDAFW